MELVVRLFGSLDGEEGGWARTGITPPVASWERVSGQGRVDGWGGMSSSGITEGVFPVEVCKSW